MVFLLFSLGFITVIEVSGRCETPVGVAGQVRFRSGQKGRHANTTTSCSVYM